jgi:hypothetical protein
MPTQPGATEVVNRRGEDVRHWRNLDGTRTALVAYDLCYPNQGGNYQPVDLNFVQVSTTEWVADRTDVIAPDCERVFFGRRNTDAWFESVPQSFWDGLPEL